MASLNPAQLLEWYTEVGADEAIGDDVIDRLQVVEKPTAVASVIPISIELPGAAAAANVPPPAGVAEAVAEAQALANGAMNLEELQAAIRGFTGLTIQRTASNLVFADGLPSARVMLVGEAPSADDDRAGRPFSGMHGELLDKMLASIGLNRGESAYLTGVCNWYPPGGRALSDAEIAMSLPFLRRHIELINPAVLVCVGQTAARTLMESAQSIMRLRGRWLDYGAGTPAMALFHPSYLIASPAQKKQAWSDLLMLRDKLHELKVI